MKRGTQLKALFALSIAMFLGLSVSAQVADNNYVEGGAAAAATEVIDTVTVGTRAGYYAEPDALYHPGYTAPGWALTADFTWTWAFGSGGGTLVGSGSETHTTPPANYVEVDWGTTAGTYTLEVQEVAPAAYGGCTGATETMTVEVVAEPTIAINADAAGTYLGTGATHTYCAGDARLADAVGVTITGFPSFRMDYSLQIHTQDVGGTPQNYYTQAKAVASAHPTVSLAVDNTNATGTPVTVNTNSYDLQAAQLPNGGFTTITEAGVPQITVYTFTVNAVNDRISRKSDYLGITYAAGTNSWFGSTETLVVQVNPAPTTGPIYHVGNMWAN